MQKFTNFRKLLFPLFLTVCLWTIFIISRLILTESNQEHLNFFPANAVVQGKINSKLFLKKVTNALFTSQNQNELISQIESKLHIHPTDTTKMEQTGIDLSNSVGFFLDKTVKGEILGFLVSLHSTKDFNNYCSTLASENVGFANKNAIGVVIVSQNSVYSFKELQSIASKYLSKKTENPFENTKNENNLVELQISSSVFGLKNAKKNFISIKDIENGFKISGTLPKLVSSKGTHSLKSKGLHFRASTLPASLQKEIQSFFVKNEIELANIQSIECNYSGVNLEEGGEEGFFIQPNLEMLVTFDSKTDKSKIYNAISKIKNWESTRTKNGISIGSKSYQIDSLSPYCYYLGNNTSNIIASSLNTSFTLDGNLSELTNISGASFIVSFLDLMPPFSASKKLFNSISTFTISTTKNKNEEILDGKITFKKGENNFLEFVRFGLNVNGTTTN